MRLTALIADTFREIYAKKVIIGIIVIQIITISLTALILFNTQDSYREAASDAASVADSLADAGADSMHPLPGSSDTALLGSDTVLLPMDSVHATDSAAGSGGSATFIDTTRGMAGAPVKGKGDAMLLEMVKGQMGAYAAMISLAAVFLGIFVAAGIVPSMMEKGTVDLLLSKPLPRTTILFGRALGGLIALALNLLVFVLAIWALYGMATTVWHFPFVLWTFSITLFAFILMYSAIILLNVYTESWVLPMCMAYIHLVILATFLFSREETLYAFVKSDVLRAIVDGLYYILPQTAALVGPTGMVSNAVYTGSVSNMLPFVQGLVFTAVALSWAAWKFQRKDF